MQEPDIYSYCNGSLSYEPSLGAILMDTESIPSALISGIKPMNHTSQLLQSRDCKQLDPKQNPAQFIFFKLLFWSVVGLTWKDAPLRR